VFGAPLIWLRETLIADETIRALDIGVDDVLHAKVDPQELLARVASIRNRVSGRRGTQVECGELTVPFDGRPIAVSGRPLYLNRAQVRVLQCLARNMGRMVPREQIFSATQGIFETDKSCDVVDVHICHLRKRLAAELGRSPIGTVWGQGYIMTTPDKLPKKVSMAQECEGKHGARMRR
jgi:two-component system response regulator CpxR